jgi:uncharacterized protein YggU (UPF0235/DUF167 family)
MRATLVKESSAEVMKVHRDNLCVRLQQRAQAARGNQALLQMLAKEAQAMSCDIPELADV